MNQQQPQGEDSGSSAGLARIAAALEAVRAEVTDMLAQDSAVAPELLLELARVADGVARTGHGLLVQVLGRIDQVKAARGGTSAWLTAQLGYPPGRARALAEDARRLGALPAVAEQLSAGELPAAATRVLARAAHAATRTQQDPAAGVADTLSTLQRDGIQAAERQVRLLEHTLPGHGEQLHARQRAASFARVGECDSGMVRFDVLLDAERGTLLRTALDLQVSTWLRERQYDHTDLLPDDVRSTEQLTAEAFTHLAEVFLSATETQRANRYTPTVLYYAPAPAPAQDSASAVNLPPIPPGCAETSYGTFVPATRLPGPHHPAALHLTLAKDGQPAELDGRPLDHDPAARLAGPAQRLALAMRDRHCTYPGCTRPAPWGLLRFYSLLLCWWVVVWVWVFRRRLKIGCGRCSPRSGRTLMSGSDDCWPGVTHERWVVAGSGRWPELSGCARRRSRAAWMSLRPELSRPGGCVVKARGAGRAPRLSPNSSRL